MLNISAWLVPAWTFNPYVGVNVPDVVEVEKTEFKLVEYPVQSCELYVLIDNVFLGMDVAIKGVDR